VGAVGYNLLTAKPVFESKTNLHLYSQILNDRPLAPSSFIKGEIPSELEVLVLRCLEKDPNDRPQDVAEILENLESLPGIRPWTQADACAWWQERELPQNVNAAN
jgi:serine/threonine-protein kinase